MGRRTHTHDTDIDWEVIGVFDPDGDKPDFSYTVGLHAHGLPELHLWARPSDGADPGQDWGLSQHDRHGLLNRWARRLRDGDLRPGSSWTDEMDFGLVRVTFTVGDPVIPAAVDAFAVASGATVLPVRFALERAPSRVEAEPDAEALALIAAWTADVVASSGAGAWADDGSTGPAGGLLAAVRAAVAAASHRQLTELFYGVLVLDSGTPMGPRRILAGAVAHARVAGRNAAVEVARSLGTADAERLMADPDVDRELMEFMHARPDEERMRGGIHSLLSDGLEVAYACAVLVDVLPHGILSAGLAPVLSAVAPIPQQQFSAEVSRRVRARLGRLSQVELAELANLEFDADAVGAVLAAALLAGADAPPFEQLLAGTRTAASARSLGPRWHAALQRALTDLARAVAYPDAPGADRLTAHLPGRLVEGPTLRS